MVELRKTMKLIMSCLLPDYIDIPYCLFWSKVSNIGALFLTSLKVAICKKVLLWNGQKRQWKIKQGGTRCEGGNETLLPNMIR